MSALVHSKFEEELIKIKFASMETLFSNYESMEKSFDAQGHVTPKSVIRCGRNSNSSEILCLSWLPASLTKIRSKVKATHRLCGDIVFSPLKVNGRFLLPWQPQF